MACLSRKALPVTMLKTQWKQRIVWVAIGGSSRRRSMQAAKGKAGGEAGFRTQEIEDFAQQWLGNRLVTYQTDKDGQPVYKLLIEECTEISMSFTLAPL